MRIAAIQFDIAWEDKAANHAAIEGLLDKAGVAPGTFVLLPELGDTGFSFNLEVIVDDRSLAWGRQVAQERSIILQVGHAERGPDGRGRNCATIIGPDGGMVGQYQKVHPFSYGREIEHFSGGDHLFIADLAFNAGKGAQAAQGEDVMRLGDTTRVCPLICYDLRFPELWRIATCNGAEVFTIGASWPAARQQHWRSLLIARAIENQAYVVGVNRVGADPHLEYLGGSLVVSPTGEIVAEAGDYPAVLQADLDIRTLRTWRETFPALDDMRTELLGSLPLRKGAAETLPPC